MRNVLGESLQHGLKIHTLHIHVISDFKAQQMLPTDRLQVFVLLSLAHRIAFSDF